MILYQPAHRTDGDGERASDHVAEEHPGRLASVASIKLPSRMPLTRPLMIAPGGGSSAGLLEGRSVTTV